MASRSSIERRRAPAHVGALAKLAVTVAVVCAAPVARADDAADADAALQRGVALRREGKDAEALEAFERALASSPSPRARAQVALAQQALALWVAAEQNLALVLAESEDPWIKQNRAALEGASRVVASKLAWANVVTNVRAEGLEIVVNGTLATPDAEGRVRVVAGQVTVEARAPGYEPASTSLQIAPETTAPVELVLARGLSRAPVAPTDPAPPEEDDGSARRTAGWIVTGAGALALGAGVVFGVRAISKKDERDADCAGGCSQIGVDADKDGRTAGLVSTVAVLGGVAAGAAGLWLLLGAPPPSPKKSGDVRVRLLGSFVSVAGEF